jgi:hypothetical protein
VDAVITIRLRKNGPYVIDSDDVSVVDWNGQEYRVERRRLRYVDAGASTNKAVLRRHALTHRASTAAEAAVGPEAEDNHPRRRARAQRGASARIN